MWSNDGETNQTNGGVVRQAVHSADQVHPDAHAQLVASPPPPAPAAPSILTGSDGAFDVPPTLMERIELCRFLADAELLPKALQQKPANLLLLMHKAMALNVPLGMAIDHMYVIDGKVDNSAELLRILIHRAGHVLRWPVITDKEATGELTLRHDPRNPRRFTFTIAQAQAMGLTNKDNWRKDAASMLVARCTTRLVTYHCPEIAGGMGNLSALDFEEEHRPPETVHATAEAGPSLERQAAELFNEAQEADTAEALKVIGARAREAHLLEVLVADDTTLQNALLARIDVIAANRSNSKRTAAAAKADA